MIERACWCGRIQPCPTHPKVGGSDRRPKLKKAHWQKLCIEVRRRDRVCQECGSSKRLSVHHIKAARHGGRDEMSNLVLLCSICHASWERTYREAESLGIPLRPGALQNRRLEP